MTDTRKAALDELARLGQEFDAHVNETAKSEHDAADVLTPDAELIARLRGCCSCNIDSTPCAAESECRDAYAAAARLEALLQAVQHANDHADAAIKDMEALVKYRDAYAECDRIATEALRKSEDRAERLEAALQKLACKCPSNCDWERDDICPSWIARAALAQEDRHE
jgi:hypothetical protein